MFLEGTFSLQHFFLNTGSSAHLLNSVTKTAEHVTNVFIQNMITKTTKKAFL